MGKWKDRKLTDIEADAKKMLSAAAKDLLAGIRRGARVDEEVPRYPQRSTSCRRASCTARNLAEKNESSVPEVASAPEHGGAAASSASGIRRAPSLAGGSRDAKKPRLRLQESLRKRAHEDTPEDNAAPAIVEEGELRSERKKRARGPCRDLRTT